MTEKTMPSSQSNLAEAIVPGVTSDSPMLRVRGLGKRYGLGCERCATEEFMTSDTPRCAHCGTLWACRDIDFDLYPGEILGVVGESGSGKSTLVRCIYFDEAVTEGSAWLSAYKDGTVDLLSVSSQQRRYIRNHLMGMVYQNPLLGLKMDFSSSGNIAEKLIAAGFNHVGDIRDRASALLDRVEIPLSRMDETPRNFSGGMQQRVQISKALANNPPLLLLDEITTGLDLSVQARVLDLIQQIQRELQISMMVVSHDLSVIRMLAHRTMVMRRGRIIEHGLTDQILEDPQQPYTQLLVHSLL